MVRWGYDEVSGGPADTFDGGDSAGLLAPTGEDTDTALRYCRRNIRTARCDREDDSITEDLPFGDRIKRQQRFTLVLMAFFVCGLVALARLLARPAPSVATYSVIPPKGDANSAKRPGDEGQTFPQVRQAAAPIPPGVGRALFPPDAELTEAPTEAPRPRLSAKLWQTARGESSVMARHPDVNFITDFDFVGPVVDLTDDRGQTITGFGGAFTEAAATVFAKLSKEKQQSFLEGYFGASGLGYTVGRVHINSCDFSVSNYAFDDTEGDKDLRHFDDSVKHDQKVLIPLIRAAQDMLKAQGKELRLLASPWSPPAWMKSNHQMDHSPLPCMSSEYHDTWARYIARWVAAYKRQGVKIWAITVQNEPENDAVWEACRWKPEDEANFLGAHLGPALKEQFPEVLIFAYDHNKDNLLEWARTIYSHPAAAKYADGIAFHWYSGDGFHAVQQVSQEFPHATLLASEATYERYRWHFGTKFEEGDWSFGEGYAHDIMGDLNSGSTGWIDWNLLLDQNGGPNHAQNACDAAVMADISEGALANGGHVFRHPQFYFLGHFSKYILPGSKHLRLKLTHKRSYGGTPREYGTCSGDDGLEVTAFLRHDGLVVVVALNCGDNIISFKLRDGERAALVTIPPHAIQTYLVKGASPALSSGASSSSTNARQNFSVASAAEDPAPAAAT